MKDPIRAIRFIENPSISYCNIIMIGINNLLIRQSRRFEELITTSPFNFLHQNIQAIHFGKKKRPEPSLLEIEINRLVRNYCPVLDVDAPRLINKLRNALEVGSLQNCSDLNNHETGDSRSFSRYLTRQTPW